MRILLLAIILAGCSEVSDIEVYQTVSDDGVTLNCKKIKYTYRDDETECEVSPQ